MKPVKFSFELLERAAAADGAHPDEWRRISLVASTNSLDRYGDRIEPTGIDLKAFRRNPVVLFNHDRSTPIARAADIRMEGSKLMAVVDFPPAGRHADSDRVYSLIKDEMLNTASVAVRPLKSRPLDPDRPYAGRMYEQSELVELSIATVPVNPEAQITAREYDTEGNPNMNPVIQLQTTRDHVLQQHQALSAMAAERALSDDEMTSLRSYTDEIAGIDRRIDQARAIETQKAALAKPVEGTSDITRAGQSWGGSTVSVIPRARQLEKGEAFGLFVRALALHKGIPILAASWVERETGQMTVARALATSPAAAGGTLVPTEFSSEFIELLRPMSVVRRAGPRTLEFRGVGTISIPRGSGGAAASYIGENTKINYTEMTTDAVLLTPKKIAAITALSNELIRRSNPAADAIVRDDLLAAVATTSDAQFLRGVGSATAPAGLATLAAAGNIFPASGLTVDAITTDITKAVLALQNGNVRMIKPTWFTSPTVVANLKRQRDGTGQYIWRDELNQGTLEGYPVFTTTAIPANLGTGTNESQVILADMADIILAEEMSVAVDVSQDAAYVDGSAALISAFSFDQTVIRVVATHDFNTRHPQSIAVINAVIWSGAPA